MILVTGFGPFGTVTDNPASQVARGVHGRRVHGETVVGRVIPVSYARGPGDTMALAQMVRPRVVIGIGVAMARTRVEVERGAVAIAEGADVDGAAPGRLPGPDRVLATLDPELLAGALGAGLSDDAGRYVCNAWLHQVASTLDVPVGFVHVPPTGLDPEALLTALRWVLRAQGYQN